MTELVTRLDAERFEVHVACFRREGLWLNRVERAVASVVEFPLRSFRAPSTLPRMLQFAGWCRRHRIALVQTCDFYANVFGLTAAALARVPVRIGSRRDILLPVRSPGQHRLQRYAYRFADRIVANSRAAASQVVAEGIPETRVTVIPNGIDISNHPPSTWARGGPSIAEGPRRGERVPRRVVTTVANLRAEKGHDVLIAAAAEVCRTEPDMQFRLAGDGPMRPALEAQVRALGLGDHVRFLGHCEDVPALLADSDIFVLPSQTEAFPNGLVEGMASMLPCVASNVGGIPELLVHGQNGLLVPPGDATALAQAIRRLRHDPAEATRLAVAARQTIESRYSFTRMVGDFEQLYLSALSGNAFPIRPLYAR